MATVQFALKINGGEAVNSVMLVNKSIGKTLDIINKMESGLNKAFDNMANAYNNMLEDTLSQNDKLQAISVSFGAVGTAIKTAVGFAGWALKDALENMPNEKVEALENGFNRIKEKVAAQLLPAVVDFLSVFLDNLPAIETALMQFAEYCSMIFGVLSKVFEVAFSVAQIFIDNWSLIEGILIAIGVAMLVYKTHAVASFIATTALSSATIIMAAAQSLLNSTMLANPFFWVALLIGGLIAIIYKWVQSVGGIQIAWMIFKANLINCLWTIRIGVISAVTAVLNFMGQLGLGILRINIGISNAMGDLKVNVLTALQDMANGGIDIINSFISKLNTIKGVSIEPISHLTFATIAATENEAKKAANEAYFEQEKASIEKFAREQEELINNMKLEKENEWNEAQSNIEAMRLQIAENAKEGDDPYFSDQPSGGGDNIPEDIGATAANTAQMANAMDLANDDLSYLRDLAERDAINQFTTVPLSVSLNATNNVSSELDLDNMVSYLGEKLVETIYSSAEAVHI